MYAVVLTGGKQYKVNEGQKVAIEFIGGEIGAKINLDCLVFSDEKNVLIGSEAKKVSVEAEVLSHGKGDKITVFTYKAKKNVRTKQGHRQPFTMIKVSKISQAK